MWDSLSCLLTLLESFDKNNLEMGIESVQKDTSKDGAALLGATGHVAGGVPHSETR